MRLRWRSEVLQWLVIAAMFVASALSWSSAPDRIPIHWNLAGEPDGYGGRFAGLLLVPILALGLYLLLIWLPRVDPGRANYAQFQGPYLAIRTAIVLMLGCMHAVILLWALGRRVDVSVISPLLVGALMAVLGNFMGKIRPNWFVGVRTPWTLSSKRSWSRTHRVAGWMFMAWGLLLMASALILPPAAPAVLVGGGVVVVVWSLGYSYWAWRTDPDRVPPAGTEPA